MQPINPWLSRFAKLLVASTFCLIFLGGMVTSVNAGLSVPDWPTSYGYSMFTFPISRWVGGIFFEHTHRLLATCVGLMTTVLVAWIWRNRVAVPAALAVCVVATGAVAMTLPHVPALAGDAHRLTRGLIIMHVNIWSFAAAFVVTLLTTERDRWRYGKPWLQWLGFAAFLLVCVQGTLGGLRVTEVSTVLAMIHACTAQAFLCLTVVLAAALSPRWEEGVFAMRASRQGVPAIKTLAWTLVGAVYCQLMIGAVMRHLHAGLSIPTFPLAFGQLIPPMLNGRVAINFAHRVGALVVTLMTAGLSTLVFTAARRHARLTRAAAGLIGAVVVQVALGASVIWTRRDPVITSLHVVCGAVVLTEALLLAMRATKLNGLLQGEGAARGMGSRDDANLNVGGPRAVHA
jgi:cytochrome c oxidase assembly protein subunit 15